MPSLGTKTVYADPGEPYKTAEEMTDLCCEPRPELQCKEKVVGDIGPDMERIRERYGVDASGRDADGRLVKFVFKPRKNPCGKVVQRYKIEQKDCCDEVDEIEYDWDGSVGVLSPDTSGIVRFAGGRLPALVKVRGNGFSLDGYSTREAWTYSRSFRVYAHEMACGTCPITIDDGCTVASGSLRSTLGEWATVDYDAACPGQTIADYFESGWAYIERGGYRWRQRVAHFPDVYAYTSCGEYGSVDECPADADSYSHGQDYCGAHTATSFGRLYESWGVNGCISIPASEAYPSTSPCSSAAMPATFNSSGCPEGTRRCGTAMYFKGYEKIEKLEWIC